MIIYLQLVLPYFGKILHSAYIAKLSNLRYFDSEKKQFDAERFSNRIERNKNTKFVKHRNFFNFSNKSHFRRLHL